jgi:hypothetical protein
MSSARTIASAFALALLTLPAALPGQERRMYERRLDSLVQVFRQANARLAAYSDSVNRANRRVYDTLTISGVRVLADPASAALAQAGAEHIVATLGPKYGARLNVLTRYPVTVYRRGPHPNRGNPVVRELVVSGEVAASVSLVASPLMDTVRVSIGAIRRNGIDENVADVQPRQDIVSGTMLSAAMGTLAQFMDPTLIKWLGTPPPIDTASDEAWSTARIALLSSFASVARRCYSGDHASCMLALGLTPPADTVLDLYSPADRRRVVARNEEVSWVRPNPELVQHCLDGADSACVTILRQHPILRSSPPVHARHRVTLAQYATSMGGENSVQRLLDSPGTPADRLAAAAGVPIDSLLRGYVARARSTRTTSADMSAGVAASSFVWILACAALALGSSRWR